MLSAPPSPPPPPPPPYVPPPPPPTATPASYISPAPVTVPAKCPRCAHAFWVAHAPNREDLGWALCPRCGQPTPSLPPRAVPPVFSWEVYRRFYPEPSWPRSPTSQVRRLLVALALLSAISLLALAGAFGYVGYAGLYPHPFAVGGQVEFLNSSSGDLQPARGALVQINGLVPGVSNFTVANGLGEFSWPSVPAGWHQLRVQLAGYRISQMELFAAPLFTSNASALSITLLPGTMTNVYDQDLAPFPDLETYLAYVFSATLIELMAGALALWGAWALWRQRSVVRGVVGAAAGFLAPLLAAIAGYQTLFFSVVPSAYLIAAGAFLGGAAGFLFLLFAQRPLDGVEIPPPAT